MIRCVHVVKSDGEPVYRRDYDDGSSSEASDVPSYVRNSVALFASRPTTSSERAYLLEHDGDVWTYAFFHDFALVVLSDKDQSITPLKSLVLSLGRAVAHQYGEMIRSWGGSMAEVVDLNSLCDRYVGVDIGPADDALVGKIRKIVDSALEHPEIAFVGVFDSHGSMVGGNVPESHLFRIEVEIAQGVVAPVIDIAPTAINSGDDKIQMLRVNSFTVVAASQIGESSLHAISTVSDLAHSLEEALS
ncbi:hypothetical protein EU546_08045 [Candidatus Thorarchaeota archaeon]|jgi:hypothetical protein|nr:MAG: hypothetical protein EU546_08045 [Candidatus Thorarchaeota archaeon]